MINDVNYSVRFNFFSLLSFFMLFYAFSIGSYGYLLSGLSVVVFFLLVFSLFYLRIKIDLTFFLCTCVIFIHLFWNNYLIRQGGLLSGIMFPAIWFSYLVMRRFSQWHKTFLYFTLVIGAMYILGNYLVNINQDFFFNYVAPFYDSYNLDFHTRNPMAGLTSNYGSNGLFMSFGLIAFFSIVFYKKSYRTFFGFIILLLMFVAILMSGKRWISIALLLSIILAYFLMRVSTDRFLILKACFITVISLLVIIGMSTILPSVNNVFNRFLQQSQTQDISSNRLVLWLIAYTNFLESPIVGKGFFWFITNIKGAEGFPVNVHNCYLQLLLEVGLLGSVFFFSFFVIHFSISINLVLHLTRRIKYHSPNIIKYCLFSLIYQSFFLLMCVTGTALYQQETLVVYILSCSIVWKYKDVLGNI